MLKIKEIMDGINAILVRLYPDRTVYVDVLPEQFERPSFFPAPGGAQDYQPHGGGGRGRADGHGAVRR